MGSQIIINRNILTQKGRKLKIDLQINIPSFSLHENGSVTLTPVLEKGANRYELPHLLINGKERHKGYKQMIKALGKKNIHSAYNIYKALELKQESDLSYNIQIDYEDWMDNAKIQLVQN
ncbi:MAG: DUF3868 domain-containing protein [Dysgonomonas sp.]|nr:DUF3868 domain-containing protein [Dysgonomonas sp.]